MPEKRYAIQGMSCQACVKKISNVMEQHHVNAHLTLQPPMLVIQKGGDIDLEKVNVILSQAGDYRATAIHHTDAVTPASEGIALPKTWREWLSTYYPLLLIVALISLVSLRGAATSHDWMMHFMAGFFITFGFFKLLDIRGFRDAYAGYDLLAKRWYGYGFIYPFLELALGFAFLFRFEIQASLWASIIVMGFGGIGVLNALLRKRAIRCACLGAVLKLPMTTVTLIENFGMVLMSILMLMNIL